jgi:pyridoxine 4-dehydrogenase
VGGERDPRGGWIPAQRPERLRAGVEANLRALEIEQVPVVNLRLMDEGYVGPSVDFDAQLAEMVALRDEGKIGGIGLSNATLDRLRHAAPAGIACVQNHYGLLDRAGEPLFDWCRENGIAWVPFFPLGSAFPSNPKVTEHPAVIAASHTLGATPAQVGLAWILAHGPHTLLIPGTSSLEHLEENVAAANVRLDPHTMTLLDALAVTTTS